MKYVLVSGGVVSGLGKGVTASSIGVILKNCGHRVTSVKIGPAAAAAYTARALLQSSLHVVPWVSGSKSHLSLQTPT